MDSLPPALIVSQMGRLAIAFRRLGEAAAHYVAAIRGFDAAIRRFEYLRRYRRRGLWMRRAHR